MNEDKKCMNPLTDPMVAWLYACFDS